MKPYYEDEWTTIYHGDAREILPSLPRVDVILTDPPYGNNTQYGAFEDTPEGVDALVGEVMPVLLDKADRVVLTPGVGNVHRYPKPTWILNWTDPAGQGSGPWGFCSWQPILVYGKDPYLTNKLGRRSDTYIKRGLADKSLGHPCTKPLNVWKWILQRVSVKDSDVILDPFMGVGTTLRAAKDHNRKVIGIELEERFCETASKRLAQEVLNLGA